MITADHVNLILVNNFPDFLNIFSLKVENQTRSI
jgi:hypothetical protein